VQFGLPPEKLRAALLAFGPMPDDGQRELLLQICSAIDRYRFGSKKQVITASTLRNQLRTIEATTRKLLSLLGVKKRVTPVRIIPSEIRRDSKGATILVPLVNAGLDPGQGDNYFHHFQKSSGLTAWEWLKIFCKPDSKGMAALMRLVTAGINPGEGDNPKLGAQANRMTETAVSLLWLRGQAELAGQNIPTREGRGGSRNRAKPKGLLIRESINIYCGMRKQYPASGSRLGFGGPMLRFISAAADLAPLPLSNKEIEAVWRVRVSKRN
jgi:hypothetical protein